LSLPALFVTLYPTQEGADRAAVGKQLQFTWLATAAALGVWAACLAFRPELAQFTWVLFFPVWFRAAHPVFLLKNPGYATAPGPERSASLAPRQESVPIPPAAWLAPVALMALSGLAIGLHSETRIHPWLIWSGGLLWMGLTPWAARLTLGEPEPLDSRGSRELEEAYADLRRFKAWAFYTMGLLAVALFALTGVLLATGQERAAIWVGAGGGSLVGVLGGVVGTWADVRRARVANLRHKLDQQVSSDSPAEAGSA
ncbi:MAG: hypothetical protein AB1758_30530, partial [Candidatus Eremiobacterota bacterium]